ncbi:cupin domain-containing protein [Kutzneria viridogrisea]|uniref:Cupin type-2 domain-containing protein n=2 Tax=Kutzneria TaxID=43356 RepID=W5W1L6_9PSEU|nr:cupin domain-containing protein [Kutzneria albida]AHH94655.1 hypothetical protein KALB_1282 [Kutzneria albida DSM 43870]MBA8930323.1 putative cupin superfamily protein [Kutzneria viridogrisea]
MSVFVKQDWDAEDLPAIGGNYRIRLSGADTGGRLAIVEQWLAPGALGAAPHVHHGHEEDFVVLDGEITFDVVQDGKRSSEVVGAGGSVAVPRGAGHGFRNEGSTAARCLVVFTPAGYEDYFREVSRLVANGHQPSNEELNELRAQFRTEPV